MEGSQRRCSLSLGLPYDRPLLSRHDDARRAIHDDTDKNTRPTAPTSSISARHDIMIAQFVSRNNCMPRPHAGPSVPCTISLAGVTAAHTCQSLIPSAKRPATAGLRDLQLLMFHNVVLR